MQVDAHTAMRQDFAKWVTLSILNALIPPNSCFKPTFFKQNIEIFWVTNSVDFLLKRRYKYFQKGGTNRDIFDTNKTHRLRRWSSKIGNLSFTEKRREVPLKIGTTPPKSVAVVTVTHKRTAIAPNALRASFSYM